MQKEKITLENLLSLDVPNIIAYAGPVMIFLVLVEWFISYRQKKDYYDKKDTLAATFIGIVNVVLSAIIKVGTFGLMLFFYNLVPWTIPPVWWSYVLCLIWIDFWRYWAHRIGHESRFWWATHVTHHNSAKYNWSVSFRLSWTQHIKIIFFVPVALTGFHPVVFFICHQIEVLYQFWIHTEYIKKLPKPVEFIFTTPSHHRVHHGSNDQYLDKNYGSTFIIWDRMFGTFQPEEERPVYGLTENINSYNPITLNFHEWNNIVKDVRQATSFREAIEYIFGNPTKIAQRKKAREAMKVKRILSPDLKEPDVQQRAAS